MILVRELILLSFHYNFYFKATHIEGIKNNISDALSRFQNLKFRELAPWGGSDSTGNPCTFASTLEQDLNQYLMASLSLNSKRTYSSGEKCFLQFCGHLKLNLAQALPASESTIIYFAVYLVKTLKVGTIKTYLSGVRNMHILDGYDLPLRTFIHLQYVLHGIKHVQGGF